MATDEVLIGTRCAVPPTHSTMSALLSSFTEDNVEL